MRGDDRRVAVLGAGIAGMVAAYELEQLGYPVEVLEGSSRLGGRIYTHRFGPNGPVAELGAMRIPTAHTATMNYVDKLGLRRAVQPFDTILSDDHNRLLVGSEFVPVHLAAGRLIDELRRTTPVAATCRQETVVFGAWLWAYVTVIAPQELRTTLGTDLDSVLRIADTLDLRPYLDGDRMHLGTVFRALPQLRAGCGPRLASFLDDILTETSAELVRLRGGMIQLVRQLRRRIHGPILMRQRVVGLAADRDGVRVTTDNGARTWSATYPAVLCTLPFSILRDLPLEGIDEDKADVIRAMDYAGATKVALHCREPFWQRAGIRGGASGTGGRTRQTYYPPVDGHASAGAVLLGSYAIAEDAELLAKLSPADRHEAVRTDLSALHPELLEPGMVLGAASMTWGDNPWSKGCTARRWGKNDAECAEEVNRAVRPHGRLYFAGEHCSSTPAWINGAIESALRAVGDIHDTLRIRPRTLATLAGGGLL